MGTRSTVKFYDRNGRNLLSLYNQYDGYLEGLGRELLDFFSNEENYGNGFEDTILLYVCYKKQGKSYHTYATPETDIEEFNYEIYDTKEGLTFKITEQRWSEEFGDILVIDLNYGTLEEFRKLIEDAEIKENEEYGALKEFRKLIEGEENSEN